MNYFNTNKQQLAIDCINLLDGVKDLIQLKLGVDSKEIEEEATLPVQDDRDGLIQALDNKNDLHVIALILLGGHSESSYKRLRLNLSVYHAMTKDRPEIVADDIETMINNISLPLDIDTTEQNTVPVSLDNLSEEEEIQRALKEASENGNKYMSRIKGGYQEYINLLEEKHKKKGRLIKRGDQVFVIDSIDGAQHIQSKKKIASVISYSTLICNPVWLNERHVTVGSSLNILTWQQVTANENYDTMMATVQHYFEEKKIRESENLQGSYSYYDMHDGKMLYLLTQHSQWNRTFHPFLLCSCKRGVK